MSKNTERFYYRFRQQYYKHSITISVWGVAHMLRQVALIHKHMDQIGHFSLGVFCYLCFEYYYFLVCPLSVPSISILKFHPGF